MNVGKIGIYLIGFFSFFVRFSLKNKETNFKVQLKKTQVLKAKSLEIKLKTSVIVPGGKRAAKQKKYVLRIC